MGIKVTKNTWLLEHSLRTGQNLKLKFVNDNINAKLKLLC